MSFFFGMIAFTGAECDENAIALRLNRKTAIALLTTTLRSLLIQCEILELCNQFSNSDISDCFKGETNIRLAV
jgi:hypothetical protein